MQNLLSVNKETINKRPMNVALLAAGTASHVWFEEEIKSEKRELKAYAQAATQKRFSQPDA